jgi:hypothetical protein
MVNTVAGRRILVKAVHELNAPKSIVVKLLLASNVTEVKAVQFSKTLSPMVITLFGISIVVKAVQLAKVDVLMAIKLLLASNVTEAKRKHELKV